jgi:prepilin signal peptidase PulO-like enzyme (type II secretory pathway)
MTFVVIFLFIFGIIFGSFISALTWRYPRQISVNKGRSICPKCKNQIRWFDNIPLLSFIFLGGKCRKCKKPISFRYPAIELSTALGFVAIGYFVQTLQGSTLQGVYSIVIFLILFLILEAIFIIDLEHRIIPDSFVFAGILVSLFTIHNSPFTSLFSGFLAATLLLLIHLITKGRGMGLGDVKFAVLGGLLVGPKLFLIWLFLAFLTGAVAGIILILGKKAGLKSQIAFGPFLVLAIPLAIIYGDKILLFLKF